MPGFHNSGWSDELNYLVRGSERQNTCTTQAKASKIFPLWVFPLMLPNRSHRVFNSSALSHPLSILPPSTALQENRFTLLFKIILMMICTERQNLRKKKKHEVPWVGKPASLPRHWGASSQQTFWLIDPLRCGLQIRGYFDTHVKEKLFPTWK